MRAGMIRFAIRAVGTAIQRLRRAAWALGWPRRPGVHAVVLTPEGKVVLVKLTYAPGWRIPGGGRGRKEDPAAALMRELREEIGLTASDPPRLAREAGEMADLFVVENVRFTGRRTIEIDAAEAFDPAALPEGTTEGTRQAVAAALASL
jgi:8-oxo-dGTP pyrophosphatase MutT (NUDIX family)